MLANDVTEKLFENFHWNVYALRMNQGLTQMELADRANVSHVAISRIEATKSADVYMFTALNIAHALGVDIGSMFNKRYALVRVHRVTGRPTNREKGKL